VHTAKFLSGLLALLFTGQVAGADAQRGKALYETHCGSCHYEKLHKRQATRIASLASLSLEVARWSRETGRAFTPAELDDIVEYLNRSHYRLDR
jgi:mono/diheme cytochrome c family protein